MRILIASAFDPIPSDNTSAGRYRFLAEALQALGHEVLWITSQFFHGGKCMRSLEDEWIDGIRYVKVPAIAYASNMGMLRVVNHWQLGRGARTVLQRLFTTELPDVIVCASPPLYWCNVILRWAKDHNIKTVLDMQDNWPKALESVQPFLYKTTLDALPFHLLNKKNRELCTAITAVAESYLTRVDDKPHEVFYLGAPVKEIQSMTAVQSAVKEEKLTLVFLGHTGQNDALANFLDSIDVAEIQVKVIGTCSDSRIVHHPAVLYKGPLYNQALYSELATAHFGLFIDDGYKEIRMPNKLFYYWACGLPVLGVQLTGEAVRWVKLLQGIVVPEARVDAAQLKQHLAGVNAGEIQTLAQEYFVKETIYSGFARFITRL